LRAGEDAGLELLERFLRGPVFSYAKRRDYPNLEGTSRLSAHLHCGSIGIRTVLDELKEARADAAAEGQMSCEVFLTELIWREFFVQILANYPQVVRGSFRAEYDRIEWSENQDHYRAWREGQTGYPIVDAAMRCLNATGWMHNRLRMVTAMFLTKDLLIHWQWGESAFMHKLLDGDLAANNGGWQWSAGSGTDAAPYFRIFNPVAQGRKFDADGEFVRRWIPELSGLPKDLVHEPWKAPHSAGVTYPKRIVLHAEQRQKCLAMYAAATRRLSGSSTPSTARARRPPGFGLRS
jgi:deoxyribodipyrimidine photo-lyase